MASAASTVVGDKLPQPADGTLPFGDGLALPTGLQNMLSGPDFMVGAYFGVLLTLAVFGAATALARRDERSVGWFALACFLLAAWLLGWREADDPAPLLPAAVLRLTPVLGLLAVTALLRHLQLFLWARQHLPTLDRLIRGWYVAVLLSIGVGLMWSAGMKLVAGAAIGGLLLMLALTIARLRQRCWIALPSLVATLMLIGGTTPSGLWWFGLAPQPPPLLALGLLLCSGTLAMGLIGVGLVIRLQGLRMDRIKELELTIGNQRLALNRASIDEVTRLPDRKFLSENLHTRLLTLLPENRKLAVISVGLGQFRAVRHGLLPASSNAGMAEIAMRMRQAMLPGDLLARVAPETFVWVTPMHASGGILDLKGRCTAMRRDICAPLANAGGVIVSCDFGIALAPEHGTDVELLLRRSDEALYRAEKEGQGEICLFRAEMQTQSHHHLRLAKQLRQALLRDELELHYQPQLSLEDGRLLGAEALIRWQHEGKMLPPSEFLPVAEASDLIVQLGEWVIGRACRQIAEWQVQGVQVPHVAVNVAAAQFSDPGFTRQVENALAAYQLQGSALTLEVTENVLLDDLDKTAELLQGLLNRGIAAAVDDFGVGYSSLSYLRRLPVRAIKIDRSFLQGIPHEAEAMSVVGTIIALGKDLGLTVIAEGIETVEQQMFLARRGVHSGQGYLFAKPLRPADFVGWLKERSNRPMARIGV